MEKTIEQIEAEIKAKQEESERQQREAYARAKGEQEVKEVANIAQDTNKTLQTKLNTKLAEHIDNNELVGIKIEETVNKIVDKGLRVQEKRVDKDLKDSEREDNEAEFKLSEDQYRAFGQSIAPKKIWQKKLIEMLYDFWFVVITFVCFFTLAPFYIFTRVIDTQKGTLKVIAYIIGVLLLLACLTGVTIVCLRWAGVNV